MKRITLTLLLLGFAGWFINPLQGQHQPITEQKGAEVSEVRLLGKTSPLAEAKKVPILTNDEKKKKAQNYYSDEMPNFQGNIAMPAPYADVAQPKHGDPARQIGADKLLTIVEPDLVLEGMDENDSGVSPPDPNGDVSSDHYIQIINSGSGGIISVWDKNTGELLLDATSLNTFWEPFGVTGLGDGVVLFDQQADRWLVSELGTFGTNAMLVAISETSDPFGNFFVYEFSAPNLPDYPKYGIWNNAYMITTNEGSESEIPVYLLDRQAMLNGAPTADMQRILAMTKFSDTTGAFQVATAADWDGNTPPPANSPQYVVRIYDDAWDGGVDALELWEFQVDWTNPDNTTVNGPLVLPTEAFDSDLCGGNIFNCIEHFGSGGLLSALQQVIMNRVQYRNFGAYESILLNHSVDVDGNNRAGVRWYELRKQGGGDWEIFQQSTFSPDNDSRFMGSLAMDGAGNILMGYSVTSPNKELSLRFTGRTAGDPLGEMTIEEFEFAPGEDQYFGSRWGDYANMCIDPDDDRTFWFTGEYMKTNLWGTKIMNAVIRRDSNDIGAYAFINPVNSGFLTATEEVRVAIRNFGYLPADDFSISYQFENGPVVTDFVTDTIIQPDSLYIHTFGPTVDMSAIGDYEFSMFTSMDVDTSYFNDTLRMVISKLTRFDAGISNILGLDAPLCETDFIADAVLTNYGQDNLTAVDIIYSINGGPETTISWTGDLPFGESEIVLITSTEPLLPNNTITLYTQNPNGVVDEDMSNDSYSRDFGYIGGGLGLRLELLTDNYPAETSWKLFDSNGDELFSGGGYNQPQNLYIENWCIAEGCYTFEIYDSFGDGIQFGGIEGGYQIIREADEVVLAEINQVNFGTIEINPFCTDLSCLIEGNYTVTNVNMPGGNDGAILMQASNGLPPYEYSITGGVTWSSNGLFENISEGTYAVVIRDAVDCETDTMITVEACNLIVSATTINASNSNSEDGTITVATTNGTAPFEYSLDGVNYQPGNIFDNLPAGEYTVYITDATGCSRELFVFIESTVATGAHFFGYELEIFPNPTPNLLTVNLKGMTGQSTMWVQILDISGRQVKVARLVAYNDILTGEISLKSLANGTYFLRFDHPEFNRMVKVQKLD
ncbi:MAG: T9SS type A sorting domain-containing protein [Saprospiraceae bacterium]|nr:T9SS type A sorting domain-containing protein [Saprospiraceae bacterium]